MISSTYVNMQVTHVADISGHDGAVWQLSWSHPKYGSLLASCGFDGRVIIWKEVSDRVWQQLHVSQLHTASVNAVCWAPWEWGAMLAAASSDGSLSVLTLQQDGSWQASIMENAHPAGANGISWAPAIASKHSSPLVRLVSGGSDNAVRIWSRNDTTGQWMEHCEPLLGHSDWVRDVAWAPNVGLMPSSVISSCGQDGLLLAWTERPDGSGWDSVVIHKFDEQAVWRLSWSTNGNVLAATTSEGRTTLWKEGTNGKWSQIGE